jgi:thiamine-phosphate pyrophosphorylase
MTDERMGDRLLPSIAALPCGSGIVFRHYSLAPAERHRLFEQVRKTAKRRRHWLILAGTPLQARAWKADGAHGGHYGSTTAPVHTLQERRAAERAGAQLLFISPLFKTASHQGQSGLGRARFGLLAAGAARPVIALGGMTQRRAKSLRQFGIYGWAAIDALCV